MSRVRTRPTRDDTREKLFEAAARVFEEQGIGGASIEAIAAAAGFTRGAFYSNFKSKDELIIAMLEDHVEQSIGRIRDLLDKHRNLADFIDALKTMDRSQQDPLGRSPLPLGEFLVRMTGGGRVSSVIDSHPLSADRLDRMKKADRGSHGAPILTEQEWQALRQICAGSAKRVGR